MQRGSRQRPVGSYSTISPLPSVAGRRYTFCCAFLPTAYCPWYPSLSKGLPVLCSPDFPPRHKYGGATAYRHRKSFNITKSCY